MKTKFNAEEEKYKIFEHEYHSCSDECSSLHSVWAVYFFDNKYYVTDDDNCVQISTSDKQEAFDICRSHCVII